MIPVHGRRQAHRRRSLAMCSASSAAASRSGAGDAAAIPLHVRHDVVNNPPLLRLKKSARYGDGLRFEERSTSRIEPLAPRGAWTLPGRAPLIATRRWDAAPPPGTPGQPPSADLALHVVAGRQILARTRARRACAQLSVPSSPGEASRTAPGRFRPALLQFLRGQRRSARSSPYVRLAAYYTLLGPRRVAAAQVRTGIPELLDRVRQVSLLQPWPAAQTCRQRRPRRPRPCLQWFISVETLTRRRDRLCTAQRGAIGATTRSRGATVIGLSRCTMTVGRSTGACPGWEHGSSAVSVTAGATRARYGRP